MIKLRFQYYLGIFFILLNFGCANPWHRADDGVFDQNRFEWDRAQCETEARKAVPGLGGGGHVDPRVIANLSGPLAAQFRVCMNGKGWTSN
jgi:hypothetical protein